SAIDHRPVDLAYYDLQLFVLSPNPLQAKSGPYPLTLEFARFAAPAVTVYAFVETVRLLFAAEFRRRRARNARGHVLVCGEAPLPEILSRRLRSAGRLVVDVRSGPYASTTRPAGQLLVLGDPRDPAVLKAAGVSRATALYACDEDSTTNIAIALAAGPP